MTFFSGQPSQVKSKLEVIGFSLNQCSNMYPSWNSVNFSDHMLCAGGKDGRDSCGGDSGEYLNQLNFRFGFNRNSNLSLMIYFQTGGPLVAEETKNGKWFSYLGDKNWELI